MFREWSIIGGGKGEKEAGTRNEKFITGIRGRNKIVILYSANFSMVHNLII